MIRRLWPALGLLLAGLHGLAAEPAADRLAVLRRGVNITNWFRYPPNSDPAVLGHYLTDAVMRDLKAAGFGFVRLPVQPELVAEPATLAVLVQSVARLQRAGLAVVVALHPIDWHLETAPADVAKLFATWTRLAPALRPLPPPQTFPELLNEPVFAGSPADWQVLQHRLLAAIRPVLPDHTLVLTGNDWGSIDGLLALTPDADANVVYGFHIYDPPELTALAAYRPGLDRAALARLPFPADDTTACAAAAGATRDQPTAEVIRFYCAQRWDTAKLTARIDAAADWGRRHHAAVLAGEFGAALRLNAPARLAWLATVRQACERNGIGWALWGYDDVMGFAARPLAGQTGLGVEMLPALGLADQMFVK